MQGEAPSQTNRVALFLGAAGAGKSFLIDSVVPDDVPYGYAGFRSLTIDCNSYTSRMDPNVFLIDTPGFPETCADELQVPICSPSPCFGIVIQP